LSRTAADARWEVIAIVEVPVHSQPATNVPVGTREPLLVYLHGLGEIGGERVEQVEKHGPWEHVRSLEGGYHADTRSEIARFHVLGFHLEQGDWDGAQLNDRLRAYIADHPEVDSERLYLTGVSLGGRGVLRLTLTHLRISALAVFCPAGGDLEYSDTDIERFRSVPIYFFGCPMDATVPFRGTQALQQRIGARSSRLRVVKVDELAFPSSPHVCWSYVYGHPDLYRWLRNPSLDPRSWPDMVPLPYAT
jgi:poly(3-hydroxybutyrate) depolymerase